MVNNFSCVYGRGPILPIDMLFYHDPSTWVQIWCLERLRYAYIMDIGMYSVTKPDDIVVRETPVLSLAMPCFILIRQLDQVSNKMRWNPCYRVVEQTGSVSFRIRYQTNGVDHLVLSSFFVQEFASVSDSDSDADFHAVARGISPDVLVDYFLNGLSSVTSAEPSGFK